MPTFEFAGGPIFFWSNAPGGAPAGPPLVLLHGAGGTHLHWPPLLRRATGFRVVAFDLPGHGKSGGAARESVEDYCALLAAWADAQGVERLIVGGHSLGAAIALGFALAHPQRTAGLVLAGASARMAVSPAILHGLRDDFAATVELITQYSYGPGVEPERLEKHAAHLGAVGQTVLRADFAACDAFDVRERVGEVRVPTLILGAAQDKMTPSRRSEELHRAIAGSELHVLPDTGHMIPIEQPDATTELIAAFVEKLA